MSRTNQAIGIDIGGTKTVVAAVDESGRVHARTGFETRSKRGFSTCLAELVECIRSVLNEAKWTAEALTGIGIGCAGPVNPQRGTIHNPYTLPGWDDANIVTPLREEFRVAVRLENDADTAAGGEFHFGAGRGASPLVMVTLGTGVGGAVLVNGQIYRGVNGEHPELGHIPILPDGPECYCGTRGCWESLASGTATAAAGKQIGFDDSREHRAARSERDDHSDLDVASHSLAAAPHSRRRDRQGTIRDFRRRRASANFTSNPNPEKHCRNREGTTRQ